MAGTVPTEVSEESFTGNGVTTAFPLSFPIIETSDLVVELTLDGETEPTLQVEGVDYNVSAAPSDAPTVTMVVAPPADSELHVERTVDIIQPVNLQTAGPFSPSTQTQMHDRRTMVEQQLARRLGRLEALSELVVLEAFDASLLIGLTIETEPTDVADTFPANYPLVLAPGEAVTGLIVAKATGSAQLREALQVTEWEWAGDVLTINYVTGLEPGHTYELTLLVLSMEVS